MAISRRPLSWSPVVFAAATTVPTSWTTVYTAPNDGFAILNWASFVSTTAGTYTLQTALLKSDGTTRIEILYGSVTAAGESVQLFGNDTRVVVPRGWSIQLLGAASNAVNYLLSGEEHRA